MIVIFAGPTLSHQEIRTLLPCECLPPASHGSILNLDLNAVSAIGIIDGYFEGAPSIWHKEILYAIDQGVPVYGASSMGALRAAELDAFGMKGVGQIVKWYLEGEIEDDDEVAILHGPEEVGFAVASEPMVNIRATLNKALNEGVIDSVQHAGLIEKAKSTFYKKRNWLDLLDCCESTEVVEWVNENKIDLKRLDAIAMLEQMAQDQASFDGNLETNFEFEWTNVWDAAHRSISIKASNHVVLSDIDLLVLDELRLNPEHYRKVERKVLEKWAEEHQNQINKDSGLQEALKQFREQNQLHTRAELLHHMKQKGLDEEGLTELLKPEALLIQAKEMAGDLSQKMVDALIEDGTYAELNKHAEEKDKVLAGEQGALDKVKRGSYLVWYFEDHLKSQVPHDLDKYWKQNGFRDGQDADRVLMRAYCYQRK